MTVGETATPATAPQFFYTGTEPLVRKDVIGAPCAFEKRLSIVGGEECAVCHSDLCPEDMSQRMISSAGILCPCKFWFHPKCYNFKFHGGVYRCPQCAKVYEEQWTPFGDREPRSRLTFESHVALFGVQKAMEMQAADQANYDTWLINYRSSRWFRVLLLIASAVYICIVAPAGIWGAFAFFPDSPDVKFLSLMLFMFSGAAVFMGTLITLSFKHFDPSKQYKPSRFGN